MFTYFFAVRNTHDKVLMDALIELVSKNLGVSLVVARDMTLTFLSNAANPLEFLTKIKIHNK